MAENQGIAQLPLSGQQRRILAFLTQATAANGYSPSLREISDAVGLASSSTVLGHLNRLEEKGYIRRSPTKPRAIQVLGSEGGSFGQRVAAIPVQEPMGSGRPLPNHGSQEPWLPFPLAFIAGDSSEYFFLTANGDSMIEAGIRTGDLLLVRRQGTARNGQIVVANLDGDTTLKYFFREGRRIRLQPANRFMDPIWVDDARIIGEVVSLIRPSV